MDRLWDWYKKGTKAEDIDGLIAGLKKANARKGLLLKHQTLDRGDVMASVSVLFVVAAQKPRLAGKVAEAMLDMNSYLNYNYPRNENANMEKIAIPAALEVINTNIQQNIESASLRAKVKLFLDNIKLKLAQEETAERRDLYDRFASSYKETLAMSFTSAQSEKTHQPTRNSRGQIEI